MKSLVTLLKLTHPWQPSDG